MKNVKNKIKEIFTLNNIALTLFVIVMIVTIYYILFPSRGFFHSDSADTIMWAEASYVAKAVFNQNFDYACLLPFGGHLLMIPFIAMWGVSMNAHIAGMLLFFVLFVASFILVLRQMKWSLSTCLLATTTFISLLLGSEKLREIFFGHIIYYSLGLFFLFIGMALVLKILDSTTNKNKFVILNCVLLIWCLLTGMNQLQTLTLFTIPLLGAIIAEQFFDFEKKDKKFIKKILAVCNVIIIGTGLGYIFGSVFKGEIIAGYQDAFSNLSGKDMWLKNALQFPEQWITLIGVDILDGDYIASFGSIINMIRIMLSVVLFVCPIIVTVLYPKLKDRSSKFWIFIHWITTALIMVAFTFGRLADANWRLSPILATSIITTMILIRWIYNNLVKYRRLLLLIIAPIAMICLFNVKEIATMPSNYKQDEGLYVLAEELHERGLSYGYGTFWQANALTVISNSKVKCRSIDVFEDKYAEYTYQQDRRWFIPEENYSKYFVVLTETEYYTLSMDHPLRYNVIEAFSVDNYRVFVYNRNIFPRFLKEVS